MKPVRPHIPSTLTDLLCTVVRIQKQTGGTIPLFRHGTTVHVGGLEIVLSPQPLAICDLSNQAARDQEKSASPGVTDLLPVRISLRALARTLG